MSLIVFLSFAQSLFAQHTVGVRQTSGSLTQNRSAKYTVSAAGFSYPIGDEWSDLSDWRECGFTIDYDAANQMFTFNTARIQNYRVIESDYSDPSHLEFSCKDLSNNRDCVIHVATIQDDGSMGLYLVFDDEMICYVIEEQAAALTKIGDSSNSTQTSLRILPEVIQYPSYSKSYSNHSLSLAKVTANSYQTVLDFEYMYEDNQSGGIWLSPKACIIAYPSGQKLVVNNAEGINLSQIGSRNHYKGEKVAFRVYFGALPANTTHFDFIEEEEGSNWVFCGVSNTAQYKRDFLMLNSTSGDQSITWEWYGGTRTFFVATTAMDYDIVGLPSWCNVTAKEDVGFRVECEVGGENQDTDYFYVKANGNVVRVNVTRKQFYEHSSPQGSFSNVAINHLSSARKIVVSPKFNVKNMSGKDCTLVFFLLDSNGEVVNDPEESAKEFSPTSNSYSNTLMSATIDYGVLHISNISGYTIGCALYDNENDAYFSVSDQKKVH